MNTLGERVKKIIAYNGTTMTQFAKELNISQSMVSKICADKAAPSDRTITDICRIYNINKDWILHGIGDMVDTPSLESELTEIFKDTFPDNPDIRRDFVSTLASLPPAVWHLIRDYACKLAEECKHNPNAVDPYIEGYNAGLRAAREAREILDGLDKDVQE